MRYILLVLACGAAHMQKYSSNVSELKIIFFCSCIGTIHYTAHTQIYEMTH